MRVSRLNYNTYYPNTYNKNNFTPLYRKSQVTYNGSINNINFNGKFNKNFFVKLFNIDPIYAFKNFSKEEYIKLSESQKKQLIQEFSLIAAQSPDKLTNIGKIHAYAADCIQNTFDKRFGKNNYLVILIGRSLSSIGKSLGLKIGEKNVVDIPMSCADRFFTFAGSLSEYQKFLDSVKQEDGLKTFLRYLKKHNLSKKDIETSGKNYILMDYCFTGESLKGAEQFFKSDEIWGNKKNNIFAVDFLKLLNKYDDQVAKQKIVSAQEELSIFQTLRYALFSNAYKNYATIGKSITLKDTISASKSKQNIFTTPKETKLVWFNLIDTIMSGKGNFQLILKTNSLDDIEKQQAVKLQKNRTLA